MENYGKTRPFTCYYCHKNIQNDSQQGHLSICGSVLEPCINKCGSYIPRNTKARHMKECVNNKSKSMSRLITADVHDSNETNSMDTFSNSSGISLGNPSRQRINSDSGGTERTLQIELFKIKNKLQTFEQFTNQTHQNINIIKSKYQESSQMLQSMQMQTQLQSEKMQYQQQMMLQWKKSMELQIDQLKQEVKTNDKNKSDFASSTQNIKERLNVMDKLEKDLGLLNQILVQEQIFNREFQHDFHAKLNELKDSFTQENAVIGALWTDHKNCIEHLNHTASNTYKLLDEQKSKQSSLIFDLRTTTQIAAEASEKLEIQDKKLTKMIKDLSQVKLDVQTLEEIVTNNLNKPVSSEPGRLLWKINDFALKMDNAKEKDTVLRSQIFYTHDYGYKIRLEVYLNGIKKWKGRHMIACIQVLKGEYDLLLKWPCIIEGTIKIRDLYEQDNPKHFSKPISAKRHVGNEENEEPQESSAQYIFVPHTMLFKEKFVKEDAMFIEVLIHKPRRNQNETDL